jgi:hypothetical protein
MPAAEKAQLSALMKERQAYTGLNKPQRQALFQYMRFDQALVSAQQKSQPQVLTLFAAGLKAITPALAYLHPLAKAAADALLPLVNEVGKLIQSGWFKEFMGQLTQLAKISIGDFGQALINVAKGIGNIFIAISKSGLGKEMADAVLKISQAFLKWTTSKGFTDFLSAAHKNAPTVLGILKNLASIIGSLFKSMQGGLGTAD